jgi:hypothetical protein
MAGPGAAGKSPVEVAARGRKSYPVACGWFRDPLKETDMQARPRTKAAKKRRVRRKEQRRAGSKPSLGIPPRKGKK